MFMFIYLENKTILTTFCCQGKSGEKQTKNTHLQTIKYSAAAAAAAAASAAAAAAAEAAASAASENSH